MPTPLRDTARAYAPSTLRSYSSILRRFHDWRRERGLYLRGHRQRDEAIAAFLDARFHAGNAPATLAQIAAALRHEAREEGRPDPVGPLSARTLAVARRAGRGRGRGQVRGLRWADVDAMATLAAADRTLRGLRDAAAIRLGSDAMLRISELAAVRVSDVERVQLRGETVGVLTVPVSKTDQEGRGAQLPLGPPTVAAIDTWIVKAGIVAGPLLRGIDSRDRLSWEPYSVRMLRTTITVRALAAGIAGRVSGHSLRVGAAQDLRAAGAEMPELMQAGRWRDAATVAGYTAREDALRGAVLQRRYRLR